MTGYLILWMIIIITAAIVEAVTLQLVTIWFVFGAIAALIAAGAGASFLMQMILFTIISALFLCITRPIIRKMGIFNTLPDNMDGEIGKIGTVIQDIDNQKNTGRVKIGGVYWKAKTIDNRQIPAGDSVRVEQISGTTAYVSKT